MVEKERRTRGESSASTARAREAVVARCAVGKGMLRVSVQGNDSSCLVGVWVAMLVPVEDQSTSALMDGLASFQEKRKVEEELSY